VKRHEADAWLAFAYRRLTAIARYGSGAAQQLALSFVHEFERAEQHSRDRGNTDVDIVLSNEWGPIVRESIIAAGHEFDGERDK
jgi:hypothetical protein